ncbi:glycoside hydrolase family 15 protein [Actinopolymorpha pittospori]|uniref:GH15 family glucan-1,4-alpha-glucosidase n=1 Tax=Actinopolymorpha pittospori TaxID=648752 RepID=A0A927N7F1_9ACTN|nr:glycoside hydrolase family 15 protein [Actinopolymorpha pittospori]MBE1613027.1 GH15 family glucan-1,4-alpha-glucosidase [Actinopolymorpha pittospori]
MGYAEAAQLESDDYLPIADHGLIGDMRTAALVGTDGTIDWYCCPRFDSPSVFGAILDREHGGRFVLCPRNPSKTKQLYFPDTNVLITRFFTVDGVAEVEDFMPISAESTQTNTRRHRVIRRILCTRGTVPFGVKVAPRFDYGREEHDLSFQDGHAVFTSSSMTLALSTSIDLGRDGNDVTAEFTLSEGQSTAFVLDQLTDGMPPRGCEPGEADQQFRETVAYWRKWLSHSRYTGRWRETVHRSALALKLLTYQPTGAIVAAPTTSLPEQIGGERNWDYRYTWVRDAAFSVYALLRLGFTDEARAFMDWLGNRMRECRFGQEHGPLQVMYGIDGRTELPEETLDHLEGYRGSAPVRIGNGAAKQRQQDIYGELIDSVYLYNKYGEAIGTDLWEEVTDIVDWVCDHWDEADEGIWETRGGREHFTYSRLMSWVAIERTMRVARQRGLPSNFAVWSTQRDAIYRQILDRGWSPKQQAFVQHYDSDVLDASLLMMPLAKFIAPTDRRWLSTLDAIGNGLVSDSLVYRYDPNMSPDGLGGREGTISICTFWYVEALTRAGRVDEARLIFEKMLTYTNHLGLFSEEIGPTGEQLGNFPQAFTHLALISAAFNLNRALG